MGSKRKKQSSQEAERRRELGGYTDAEFDREFARSQRSDVTSVSIRVFTLIVVFGLLARAIRMQGLPPWMLLLPLAFEFIAIFWIGWILSRFIVQCPAFTKSAGSFILVVVWTGIVGALGAAAIHFNPGGGTEPVPLATALDAAWRLVIDTEMYWALLAILAALIGGTVPEVTRWKRERGVFVWATIMNAGFRVGVIFLMLFFGVFVAVVFGEFILDSIGGIHGGGVTWIVYWFLLAAEVLTLVMSVLMHRETLAKQKAPAKTKS